MFLRPPKLKSKMKKNNASSEKELSVDDILNNEVKNKDVVDND